jgi:hypothetical protein
MSLPIVGCTISNIVRQGHLLASKPVRIYQNPILDQIKNVLPRLLINPVNIDGSKTLVVVEANNKKYGIAMHQLPFINGPVISIVLVQCLMSSELKVMSKRLVRVDVSPQYLQKYTV